MRPSISQALALDTLQGESGAVGIVDAKARTVRVAEGKFV
jgi:hypothetical protein